MNILIKLTCLIGLVVAPILGNGHSGENTHGAAGDCCKAKTECATDAHGCESDKACAHAHGNKSECKADSKCDMSKCSEMTKEECAAMCDAHGCSPEQKAKCMAMYDENGKFIGDKEMCCEGKMKNGKCDDKCEH